MPTFTAVALDRLLEPGSRNASGKPPPAPPPPARAERPVPISSSARKAIPKRHVSPALYATPESTPLPDSPSSASSFPPPSPYIINHKRRGPRLLKSLSQSDVGRSVAQPEPPPPPPPQPEPPLQPEQKLEVVNGNGAEEKSNGYRHEENARRDDEQAKDASSSDAIKGDGDSMKVVVVDVDVDVDVEKEGEGEDFFDLQDSMSTVSNSENDDGNGADRSSKPSTPIGEFYDAFEEISSDGSVRPSYRNIENELSQMRLNILMEIERRKQAEEVLENLQNQWEKLTHQLSLVGLRLPPPPSIAEKGNQTSIDPAEDLCQQITVSRFVASAVGRGCSRAEVEAEMEPHIQLKNFEIARLWDRLQFYEAANREMSQRNQEAVEMARQQRHRRKRKQKWFWGSIGLAVTLGTAAIAWSYLPASRPVPNDGDDNTATMNTGHD